MDVDIYWNSIYKRARVAQWVR